MIFLVTLWEWEKRLTCEVPSTMIYKRLSKFLPSLYPFSNESSCCLIISEGWAWILIPPLQAAEPLSHGVNSCALSNWPVVNCGGSASLLGVFCRASPSAWHMLGAQTEHLLLLIIDKSKWCWGPVWRIYASLSLCCWMERKKNSLLIKSFLHLHF